MLNRGGRTEWLWNLMGNNGTAWLILSVGMAFLGYCIQTDICHIVNTLEKAKIELFYLAGQRSARRQMLEESIALQRLVNDMLELSRLQNKDFPIEKEDMDLLMALEDALRAVRVLALDKEITISYVKDGGECQIVGDYGRLRQMFIATLDNAIKYSERGGRIVVDACKKADSFIISVQDYGCGIPAEELENIFARFYRGGQNREKGSGLGLAIIKSIAERHDIQVGIQSIWQEGTKISFTI